MYKTKQISSFKSMTSGDFSISMSDSIQQVTQASN